MLKRCLIIILFLSVGINFLTVVLSEACEVEEIIYYVKEKKYDPDKIRDRCRNRINVVDCSLGKVIRLITESEENNEERLAREIYERCGRPRQ